MESNVRERLIEFIRYKNLPINRFEKTCGLSTGYVANIRKSIQPEKTKRIAHIFPDLNIEWLMTGDGDMIKSAQIQESGIRYHGNIDGTAGNLTVFDDEREEEFSIMNIPGFEDCTDAINVWGDSMYPVLKSGEIIILKEWRESFIDYGKIYLVITKNGNRLIKYLKPSEKEGMVKCVSENPEHPAFDVPLDSVHKFYLVKGHIEKCAI